MRREQDPQNPPVIQAAEEQSIISTREAAEAAYLLVRGKTLARIEGPAQALSFVFLDAKPSDLEDFRNGDLVPAVDFARASAKVHQIIRARRVERHVLLPSVQERVSA
jgi:hypothetical protein